MKENVKDGIIGPGLPYIILIWAILHYEYLNFGTLSILMAILLNFYISNNLNTVLFSLVAGRLYRVVLIFLLNTILLSLKSC